MTNKYYDRLKEIQKEYPELTFNNDGYEYLSPTIKEAHKTQIEEINEILRTTILGFSRFDNFKLRKDDSFDVRCQYNWTEDDPDKLPFIGVGYFNIELFKDFEEEEK